jgi:hypothetical protein
MGGTAVRVDFDETVLRQVESEVRTIKAEYQGRLSEESIELVAGESLERLADSRVPQFVPLFVGRFTRERIKELLRSSEPANN